MNRHPLDRGALWFRQALADLLAKSDERAAK